MTEPENREDGGKREGAGESLVLSAILGWEVLKSAVRALAGSARSGNHASEKTEQSGRGADRPLDNRSASPTHRRWGTLLIFCAFLLAFGAGIAFLYLYWTAGDNVWLGATLALCLGGFGSMLVLWAHWLMSHSEAIEPREALPSPEAERAAVLREFSGGEEEVQRRSLLTWMSLAGVGVLAAMIVSLLRSLGSAPEPALTSAVWKRGQRLMTLEGKPVSLDVLEPGGTLLVFPEGSIGNQRAQTVLLRVNQEYLQLPPDRTTWAPAGYLAYSRVCTHAGCPVGLFEATTDLLLCPCHQSTFDVLRGAQPTGGPAARPLPQLPIYADEEGTLRAGGDFTEPPGPGFWGMA